MTLETYSYYCSASHLDFEFDSEGPKGRIRKVVSYCPQYAGGIHYFNLGFGDLNQATGKIDDLAVTDNQDREKILATKDTQNALRIEKKANKEKGRQIQKCQES